MSGKVLVFRRPETYVKKQEDVPQAEDRIERIRKSLDKINKLIAELKDMPR